MSPRPMRPPLTRPGAGSAAGLPGRPDQKASVARAVLDCAFVPVALRHKRQVTLRAGLRGVVRESCEGARTRRVELTRLQGTRRASVQRREAEDAPHAPPQQTGIQKITGTSWICLLFLISNSATLSRAREHHSALSDHDGVRAWPGPLAGGAGSPGPVTGGRPQDVENPMWSTSPLDALPGLPPPDAVPSPSRPCFAQDLHK